MSNLFMLTGHVSQSVLQIQIFGILSCQVTEYAATHCTLYYFTTMTVHIVHMQRAEHTLMSLKGVYGESSLLSDGETDVVDEYLNGSTISQYFLNLHALGWT